MTLMEKLSQGLPIAVIGYVMVFVVLAILWGAIELMRVFLTPKKPKIVEEPKTIQPENIDVAEEEVDEGELVVVLTAAIAASLNTSTYNLKIKSFKRIDTKNNVWSNASRNDAINKF